MRQNASPEKGLLQAKIREVIECICRCSKEEMRDGRYQEAMETLDTQSERDVVPVMIEVAREGDMTLLLHLTFLIKDLHRFPSLPRQIMAELRKVPPNSRACFALLYVYSLLPIAGYPVTKNFDTVIDEIDVNLQKYTSFVKQIGNEVLFPLLQKELGNQSTQPVLCPDYLAEDISPLRFFADHLSGLNAAGEEEEFTEWQPPMQDPDFAAFAGQTDFPLNVQMGVDFFRRFVLDWKGHPWADATSGNVREFFGPWLACSQACISKRQFFKDVAGVKAFLAILHDRHVISDVQHQEMKGVLYDKKALFEDFEREIDYNDEEDIPRIIAPFAQLDAEVVATLAADPTYDNWVLQQVLRLNRQIFARQFAEMSEDSEMEERNLMPFRIRPRIAWEQKCLQKVSQFAFAQPKYRQGREFELSEFMQMLSGNPSLEAEYFPWPANRIAPAVSLQEGIQMFMQKDHEILAGTFQYILEGCQDCPVECYAYGPEQCSFFQSPPQDAPCVMTDVDDALDYLEDVFRSEDDEDDVDNADNADNADDADDDFMDGFDWLDRSDRIGTYQGGRTSSHDDSVIANWCEEMTPAWQKSPEYATLPQYTWKVRDEIPMTAVELGYSYHNQMPQEWTWEAVEDTLLHVFPREVTAPKYYFKAIGRVMHTFCQFLARNLRLTHLEGFPAEIKKIQNQLDARANDPQTRNPTKFLFHGEAPLKREGYHFDF